MSGLPPGSQRETDEVNLSQFGFPRNPIISESMMASLPSSPADPPGDEKLVNEAAERMITRFGERALTEVKRRVSELEDHGEVNTKDFWRKVQTAVALLLKKDAGPGH